MRWPTGRARRLPRTGAGLTTRQQQEKPDGYDQGIDGQSTLDGFEKSIELQSFSHGIAQMVTSNPSNSERTTGGPSHSELSVSKCVDIASCPLIAACNEGKLLKEVTLTVGRVDNGKLLPIVVYKLENVLISSISHSGGGGRPMESLSLNYTKIEWSYTEQDPEVKKKGNNGAVWDLTKDKGK